jgi:hypothetical protein
MKKYLALALVTATMSVGFSTLFVGNANAGKRFTPQTCNASVPGCLDYHVSNDLPDPRGPTNPPPTDPGPGPRIPPEPPHDRPQPQDPWHGHGHGHGHWDNQDDYGISCGEGRSIVRQNGFRHVRAMDCSGDVFVYSAKSNHGRRAIVSVNMDGEIDDVSF